MSNLHVLQAPLTPEGACRLSASLVTMIEAGVDAGPRGPQIRSLGTGLEVLVKALRSRLAGLIMSEEVDDWITQLERLARDASAYEAD